jgi:hypothetical protein
MVEPLFLLKYISSTGFLDFVQRRNVNTAQTQRFDNWIFFRPKAKWWWVPAYWRSDWS